MSIFDKIDKLKAEWDKLQPLSTKDQKRLDEKFRLEFNYNSNHIEGNTLTYGETKLLLIFDDTRGGHTMREYEEMKAHDVAYKLIVEWAADPDFGLKEKDIKELNELILVRPYYKEAITQDGQNTRRLIKVGEYKEYPNSVRLPNGEMFEYASPIETPILMRELMEWYRSEEGALHPLTLAAMLHYKFVRIHPFDDGNGRLSRLLMNYVLLKNRMLPVVVKSDDKVNYLRALRNADAGDYEAFIGYIAEQSAWSLELGIKAARGGSIEESDDIDKKLNLLQRKIEGLQDGDEEPEERSLEFIHKAIVEVGFPIVRAVLEKLKAFNKQFVECSVNYMIDGIGMTKGSEDLDELIKLFENEFESRASPGKIEFKMEFRHLKKASTSEVHVWLDRPYLQFEQYYYILSLSGDDKHEGRRLKYNQSIDEAIKDEAVKRIVEDFMSSLEKRLDQLKKS